MQLIAICTKHAPADVVTSPIGTQVTRVERYHVWTVGASFVAVHMILSATLTDTAKAHAAKIPGGFVAEVEVPGDVWPTRAEVAEAMHIAVMADVLTVTDPELHPTDDLLARDVADLLKAAAEYVGAGQSVNR